MTAGKRRDLIRIAKDSWLRAKGKSSALPVGLSCLVGILFICGQDGQNNEIVLRCRDVRVSKNYFKNIFAWRRGDEERTFSVFGVAFDRLCQNPIFAEFSVSPQKILK